MLLCTRRTNRIVVLPSYNHIRQGVTQQRLVASRQPIHTRAIPPGIDKLKQSEGAGGSLLSLMVDRVIMLHAAVCTTAEQGCAERSRHGHANPGNMLVPNAGVSRLQIKKGKANLFLEGTSDSDPTTFLHTRHSIQL